MSQVPGQVCSACGQPVPAEDRYCEHCGELLDRRDGDDLPVADDHRDAEGPSGARARARWGRGLVLGVTALSVSAAVVAAVVVLRPHPDPPVPPHSCCAPSPSSVTRSPMTTSATTTSATTPSATTPVAQPVDLDAGAVAQASSTAPASVDDSDNTTTFAASNTLDGDPATVWRTVGSGVGASLVVSLDADRTISALGLVNGYAKADPARCEQARRPAPAAPTWGTRSTPRSAAARRAAPPSSTATGTAPPARSNPADDGVVDVDSIAASLLHSSTTTSVLLSARTGRSSGCGGRPRPCVDTGEASAGRLDPRQGGGVVDVPGSEASAGDPWGPRSSSVPQTASPAAGLGSPSVLFLTPDLRANSLGRTYCLHLLCEALGWRNETWSVAGDHVWTPLAGEPFAATCSVTSAGGRRAVDELAVVAERHDLLVAVKPLPQSFGVARRVSGASGTPLLVDIDDPDLDVLLARDRPLKHAVKWFVRPRVMVQASAAEAHVRRTVRTVSNPVLERQYGGQLVTHVRGRTVARRRPVTDAGVLVAFVGTPQRHKGLELLREAVTQLADDGFRLLVSAEAPGDARPHEQWVGRTGLAEGLQLTADADVVVIPSLDTAWARGQLPVKLVDAMMSGTPVVASAVAPLPWALGPDGMTFPAGGVSVLVARLRELSSPRVRAEYGARLQLRAQDVFGLASNARAFARACETALRGGRA